MERVTETKNIKLRKITATILCIVVWTAGTIVTVGFLNKSKVATVIEVLLVVQLLAALWDINSMTIPVKITVPAILVGVGIMALTGRILEGMAASIVSFILMKLLTVISRNQVGGGDIAIMTITGLYSGISTLISILFTSVTLAGLFSSIFILSGKAHKKTEIPFAPFILSATVMLILIGYVQYL
ncbi:A24 family peptidase [Clostridium sp. BNL1100]|uniref:prepilin peptidase n=1 Tax=Clostridium sp. BNL1100 TaxID=755731 RepID=UPI00024A7C9F|nr:A24 family peptidase [Clostridium sp. BNL1100]AEY65758.1 prepilin signal peptidase PulO-like peptidase [Clostridium sp. BNL1100]